MKMSKKKGGEQNWKEIKLADESRGISSLEVKFLGEQNQPYALAQFRLVRLRVFSYNTM